MATSTATTTGTMLSNAASVVGRHIRFLDTAGGRATSSQTAVIISYNPENNAHTVEFQDGTEKVVVLNQHRFKFLVSKCEPADKRGHRARMLLAAQRDAVGRPIKVFSNKLNKYMHGTITACDEGPGKHAITLKNKNKTMHHLDLQSKKLKWRYCDMIGGTERQPGRHSIISSKFAGVQRNSESSWVAYKGANRGTERYIGTFTSEKDAALAPDYFARKQQQQLKVINFPNEHLTEVEIEKRRLKQYDYSGRAPTRGRGKSKYRGVSWKKNRKRWMSSYHLQGGKSINLGAFENAEYVAMAFDFEARKRGRPECHLNFPDEHPTEEQIEQWKTNTSHYTMMASGRKKSSQHRGVSWNKRQKVWYAHCNITTVVKGMGKQKGPVHVGSSKHEKEAALAFDRACRKFCVPEKELNFPRNHQLLKEVRLFDNECYFCFQISPTDPVATPCNHVFCRACISPWLEQSPNGSCPCCKMPDLKKDELRSVTLVPWALKPDHSKTHKRKRNGEKKLAPVPGAAKSADNSSSDSEMEDDDNDNDAQAGPPSDSDHDGSNVHKTADAKRIKKRGSKQKDDTRDEYSSDDDTSVIDQAADPSDSQRPKKQQATWSSSRSSTSRHAASLAKSPAGPPARRRQVKYPIGTRFIKEFKGHGKFEGRVVNFNGTHYKVYYPEDGDKESLREHELDVLDIVKEDQHVVAAASYAKDCWCSSAEESEQSSDDDDDMSSIDSVQPRFPIGTRFIKEFPGHGRFEGRVVDFDGKRYEVHYPQDGDEEVMDESELERLEMILDANDKMTGQQKGSTRKEKMSLL